MRFNLKWLLTFITIIACACAIVKREAGARAKFAKYVATTQIAVTEVDARVEQEIKDAWHREAQAISPRGGTLGLTNTCILDAQGSYYTNVASGHTGAKKTWRLVRATHPPQRMLDSLRDHDYDYEKAMQETKIMRVYVDVVCARSRALLSNEMSVYVVTYEATDNHLFVDPIVEKLTQAGLNPQVVTSLPW